MANKHLKDIIRETTEVLKEESHQHGALHEIHPNDVERVLRRGLDTILENLVQGNRIYLINSFNLDPKDYDAKYVKNPQTGELMVIEPYRAILIKPSESAKKRLKVSKKTYPLN